MSFDRADGQSASPSQRRQHYPLAVYLGAIVVLAIIAAAATALYAWRHVENDARSQAIGEAGFAARKAAVDLGKSIALLRATVASTALVPGIGKLVDPRAPCTLTFGPVGDFPTAHLDIVSTNGTVGCSSHRIAKGKPRPSYGGTRWFAGATTGPVLFGPTTDPMSGGLVEISAVPIPGGGVLVGVVDLPKLAMQVADRFGTSRDLEFLVTDPTAGVVVSRSIHPARWSGAPLAGTSFAGSSAPGARTDLDGNRRLYAAAEVPGTGWRVYAGASESVALSGATDLIRRELAIILTGLVVLLLAVTWVYRRIARPIRRLSAAARVSTASSKRVPVEVEGPSEVATLATDLNLMMATVDHQLAERRQAEQAAREAENSYHLLFESHPQALLVYDIETLVILEVNDAALDLYGYPREEFVGMAMKDLQPSIGTVPAGAAAEGVHHSGPWKHRKKDGTLIEVEAVSHALEFNGRPARVAMVQDVSAARRLEHQLRQTQRLEGLGQLAGGVAHDFNNLLSVILNYTTFVQEQVTEAIGREGQEVWHEAQEDIRQIERAAERATGLTRQLLSFARREIARPQVLNVNQNVSEVEQMLRRTLGEHVRLETALSTELRTVKIDPGQLEQVLVNLAINARDAMPGGGTLTIDTENIDVDESYAATLPGLAPGGYVRLRVSDTGVGMDRTVVERAFEPFFTTKPAGTGTGLGLATVYGIVTQAGGYVQIYSETGHGTALTVLLPATQEDDSHVQKSPAVEPPAGGSETILLVEDEESLREVAVRILRRHGYEVLVACNGPEAIKIVVGHDGPIDLLMTDMIMPLMQGKEVAHQIGDLRPGIRVLYVSGYAGTALSTQGTLDVGVTLLEKPFSQSILLKTVRQVLESSNGAKDSA